MLGTTIFTFLRFFYTLQDIFLQTQAGKLSSRSLNNVKYLPYILWIVNNFKECHCWKQLHWRSWTPFETASFPSTAQGVHIHTALEILVALEVFISVENSREQRSKSCICVVKTGEKCVLFFFYLDDMIAITKSAGQSPASGKQSMVNIINISHVCISLHLPDPSSQIKSTIKNVSLLQNPLQIVGGMIL